MWGDMPKGRGRGRGRARQDEAEGVDSDITEGKFDDGDTLADGKRREAGKGKKGGSVT